MNKYNYGPALQRFLTQQGLHIGDVVDVTTETDGRWTGTLHPPHHNQEDQYLCFRHDSGARSGWSPASLRELRLIQRATFEERRHTGRELSRAKPSSTTRTLQVLDCDVLTQLFVPSPDLEPTPQRLQKLVPHDDLYLDWHTIQSTPQGDYGPNHWSSLAQKLLVGLQAGISGVVLLHPAEGLLYTAHALQTMLHDLPVPIVLLSPASDHSGPHSDLWPLLMASLRLALEPNLAGVVLCQGPIDSTTEDNTPSFGVYSTASLQLHQRFQQPRFQGPAAAHLATYTMDGTLTLHRPLAHTRRRSTRCDSTICFDPRLQLLRLTPGMAPVLLYPWLHTPLRAMICQVASWATDIPALHEFWPSVQRQQTQLYLLSETDEVATHIDAQRWRAHGFQLLPPYTPEYAYIRVGWALAQHTDKREVFAKATQNPPEARA